ncbi:MAG TPA: polysaccharide deacetylase family protein [Bacteroidales bacterium]|nr:polysaccharide deacetylase family protein [Bacteroidales bacterium]HQI70441.1 polysaccharide deacetylase family protein [Bacteroidales bacterium]
MKKNILLTFDYELFLGQRSGSIDNCLIRPTNKILEVLKRHGAKAVFFIDTTYLYRLEELSKSNVSAEKDLQKIKEQLLEMARDGHYLFHHIHPHWLDAVCLEKINQWDLSVTNRFTIKVLGDAEREILFKYSDSYLTDIYKKASSANKCDGFRAGGLYIEPFCCFKPFFEKYGIHYEFSVVPGEKKTGELLCYDFTKCPADRPYTFNENLTMEEANGKFTEFPITKIRIRGYTKILNSIYYRTNKKTPGNKLFGDGLSVTNAIRNTDTGTSGKNYLFLDMAASIELLNPVLLALYKKTIRQKQFVHFLSHPKLQSEVSLQTMDRLLRFCNKNFECEYDFARFDKL